MSKKIYSFLLGGAVALAAFAATEFVGNGNVGKNQLIQDAKPIFVATPTADVDGTAITVNYAFTENALVKVQNVWEDVPVLASSFDMTKGDIAVSLALVNEDNETVATETATATAGNETAPVVFSDVTPGTYSITVSAKFNAATSSIEETITNVVVNKPVEAEPYEISLLSFGWPFVTLQKDDEYYVGTIELSTGNVAFNLGVKMNESDATYTVYGPTAGYTLDDADYDGYIEANENTWSIVQKNNYDVKLNWADKSIEITKAAAPTPTFPDQLYVTYADINWSFNTPMEKTGTATYTGEFPFSGTTKFVLTEGFQDKEYCYVPETNNYGAVNVTFDSEMKVDKTPRDYIGWEEYISDMKYWKVNLNESTTITIVVDLENGTIEFTKPVAPVVYPTSLTLVRVEANNNINEIPMTRTAEGKFYLNTDLEYKGSTFVNFYLKDSDNNYYAQEQQISQSRTGVTINLNNRGNVDPSIFNNGNNAYYMTYGEYDFEVDLTADPATMTVTYVGAPNEATITIDGKTTPIYNHSNVFSYDFEQFTKEAVPFTITVLDKDYTGTVDGVYGKYTISYTWKATEAAVALVAPYDFKVDFNAPTYSVNNKNVEYTWTMPTQGAFYNGANKVKTINLEDGEFDVTIKVDGNALYSNGSVEPGEVIRETMNGDYNKAYVFTAKVEGFENSANFTSGDVKTPSAALQIEAALSGDKTVVNVTWGPSISGATYTVTVTEKDDNSKAAPYTDTVSTTNCAIPVSVFAKEDAVYVIEVVANWEGGRADANKEFDGLTGIEGITVDGDAVYFDLNGRQVVNPENGLYIRVANGKAQKMIIRK